MRTFTQFITGLSSVAFAFTAISYDNVTNIAHRWNTDRPAVQARIRVNQTSFGNFSQSGYDSNTREVQKLVNQVACSKGDETKCKSAWQGLEESVLSARSPISGVDRSTVSSRGPFVTMGLFACALTFVSVLSAPCV